MKVKFIREAKLSTLSAAGPGTRVFKIGEVVELDPVAAQMYITGGSAEAVGKAKTAAPAAAAPPAAPKAAQATSGAGKGKDKAPTKADLSRELVKLGGTVPRRATVAKLEKAIAEVKAAAKAPAPVESETTDPDADGSGE